jgi:ATP-dependent Clp protease ATP-binding subunit ClpA
MASRRELETGSRWPSWSPPSWRPHTLEEDLHHGVIGQEQAVESVSDTVRRPSLGLAEGDAPLGAFLFLGPTGVGKTRLVKALAQRLFATDRLRDKGEIKLEVDETLVVRLAREGFDEAFGARPAQAAKRDCALG